MLTLLLLAAFLGMTTFSVFLISKQKNAIQTVKRNDVAKKLVSIETLIVIIFFLLSLRIFFWFEFPRIIVAGDLRPPLNGEAFSKHALYLWNEIDFGTTSVYLPRILDPFNLLIVVSGKLGFDSYTSQILALVIMYFLLSILMYVYARELGENDKILAFTAALFFNFNLFLINDREQTAVGFISVVLMILPSLVIFTRALRKKSNRLAALSGIPFILTQGTFPNYRPFLLGLFAVFLTALYFLIKKGVRINLPKVSKRKFKIDVSLNREPFYEYLKLVCIFLVSVALSSIWVIVIIAANASALLSSFTRMTAPLFALNLQFQDVFRLIAHWAFYEQYAGYQYAPYANLYLHNPLMVFLTFLVPVIAFTSLFMKSKHKTLELYFAGVGLVFLFLTSGFTIYFKEIYYSLTTNVPLLIAFRSSTNWVFFVILSYSILLGAFTSSICRKFKKKWPKLLTLGLIAVLLVSVSLPLITGDVTRNWLEPEIKGSVFPKSYIELDSKLSTRYWALLLPSRDVYVIYNYTSGTLGCGNPYPFIFSKPIISGVGTEYLASTNLDLINHLHEIVLLRNDTIRNIAPRAKITTSSSQDSEHTPNKANDQSFQTRWASEIGLPQWLIMEWKEPQELEGLKIFFEFAFAKAYAIQTWNDTGWFEQVKVENNTSMECEHVFPEPITTKKIRLDFTESSIWGSISIWELEAYVSVQSPSFSSRSLGIFGLKYLILEKNIIMGTDYDATETRKILAEKQDVILLQEWDEFILYGNTYSLEKLYIADNAFLFKNWSDIYNCLTETSWDVLDHSVFINETLQKPFINEAMVLPESFTWNEVSPCKYVATSVSKGPFFVALLESFDNRWKLRVNGTVIPESHHFKVNVFGNGWLIDAVGNLSLEILFEPQDFVAPSIIFSFLFPVLLIAWDQIMKLFKIVFKSFRKRKHVMPRY